MATSKQQNAKKKGGRAVSIKRASVSDVVRFLGEDVEVNPFLADAEIDAEDSEYQLQYSLIGLENILDEFEQSIMQNIANIETSAQSDVPLSEDIVSQLKLMLKRARARLKGDACVRLLSCIRRVLDVVRASQVQGRLQDMVLHEMKIIEENSMASRELPKRMKSPRSDVHVQRRMQHFDNLQKENATVHHLHPAQISKVLRAPSARPSLKFASGMATVTYPDTRRIKSLASRFAESQGALSAISGNMKTLGRSSSDAEVMRFVDKDKLDLRESDAEDEGWLKKQLPPRSLSANSRRPISAVISSRRDQQGMVAYQTPFDAPPPKLSGQTGGFHDGALPRRCSTAPGRMRAFTASTETELQTELDAELQQTLLEIDVHTSEHLSRAFSIKDLPRLSSPSSRKRKSRKRSEGSRRSKSSAGSEKSSMEQSQPFLERDLTEAIGTTLKAPSSGSKINACTTRTSACRPTLARSTKLPEKLESRVARMTQHFLELRGFEKPAVGRNGGGTCGESDKDTFFGNPANALRMHQCIPPTRKPNDADPENPNIVERCWTPEVGYVRGCLSEGVNPNIVKFFANPSSKLDFADYLMGDGDLQAFLDALMNPSHLKHQKGTPQSSRPLITDIILSNNKRLSDAMISRFLSVTLQENKLSGVPCVGQIKVLSFSDCIGFGAQSFGKMCKLLQRGVELRHLEEIDLQGITVPAAMWLKLCGCLSAPRFLRRLGLGQTGCGRHSQEECRAVAGLVHKGICKHLQYLDISGNHFQHEGCAAMGDGLRNACDEFREVDLSHNAGSSALQSTLTDFNPVMHVLESLGETTVTKASFVNCQISFAEDCILEDAVESSDITHLELSDNPHGEQGLRCLVRLLLARRLESLGVLGLRNFSLPPGLLKYDYVDPSAAYCLHLSHPQHRSVLRLLLKRSEQCGGCFSCFSDENLDGRRVADGMKSLCRKRVDRGGDDWQVPREGILTFTFELTLSYKPRDELETVLYKCERSQRARADFDGFARLIRLFRTLPDEQSQRLVMCAMSRDVSLKLCHLKYFLKTSKDDLNFVVVTLLPTLDVQTARTLLFDLIESCRERCSKEMVRQMKKDVRSLLYFNAMHPDGHYSLQLDSFTDRRTAQLCMVISQWVRKQSVELNRPDLSEFGNHDCLRHASLSGQKIIYDSVSWQLPDEGLFVYDFVFPRLPLNTNYIAPVYVVDELCSQIRSSPCNFKDCLKALRLVSHRLVLRPEELLELLNLFPSCSIDYVACGGPRLSPLVEAYVLLYNRTLYHSKVVSPKVLYNSNLFHREESAEIRARQGWIHTFDILGMHLKVSNLGTRYGPMDLTTWDGWIVTKVIIAVSQTEAHPNFENCYWSEKHALYERGYTFTVPKEWVPDPPRIGHFICGWHSILEEVNYKKRWVLARKFLNWTDPPRNKRRRSTWRKSRSASKYSTRSF